MKKKLKISLIILFILMCYICTVSLAASGSSSGNVMLTPSTADVNSGDTFKVVISQECSDGIIGFESDLNYDTNVFELTKKELSSEWSSLVDETSLDAMTTSSNDITSGDIFTLTFKVKENVSPVTSEIKLTGIKLHKTSNASDILQVNDKAISINVNGGSSTEEVSLSKIEVATKPSKLEYTEGEKFSTDGMVIKATYSDGTSKDITDYTYSPNGELTTENKLITISYTENGVTKTTTQAITVNSASNSNNNNTNNIANNTNTANKTNNTTTNTSNKTTNTTNTTNKTNSTNTSKDNTTTSSSLPKTGTTTKYILLIVAGLIGIAFVSYKEYQKYKGI